MNLPPSKGLSDAARALLARRAGINPDSRPRRGAAADSAPLATPQLGQWLSSEVSLSGVAGSLPKLLRLEGALEVVAASDVGLCLMHMQGTPATMQAAPTYADVVTEVADFLRLRALGCEDEGIAHERILVDPGFGFGKTPRHNLMLLRRLSVIAEMGWPVLTGLSRKSLLGRIVGRPVNDRQSASVASALVAVDRGASVVRVHDVAATRDALLLWQVVKEEELGFDEH